MADDSIIKFEGASGPGDSINLSVPLPGSHSGRRIIELEGIPHEAWNDAAFDLGTPLDEECGCGTENGQAPNGGSGSDTIGIYEPGGLVNDIIMELIESGKLNEEPLGLSNVPINDLEETAELVQTEILVHLDDYRNQHGNLTDWVFEYLKLDIVNMPPQTYAFISHEQTTTSLKFQQVSIERLRSSIHSYVKRSLSKVLSGRIDRKVNKWGDGKRKNTTVKINQEVIPRIFVVQIYGVSSFLGDYGLGKTIKTLSLLPGEETNIYTRTWRSTTDSISKASSIIDSYDSSSSERFQDTVMNETTDTSTQSESGYWQVEGEAQASWGWGKASVSAGAGGESMSGSEEFAKNVSEAVSEHAADSSSHRESSVSSSSETVSTVETETAVERTIKNINLKHTLNFVFRMLNQEYLTKVHFKDVRIAFANNKVGSWTEVPLSGLGSFLEKFISSADEHQQEIVNAVMAHIAIIFDINGKPIHTVQKVTMEDCGTRIASIAPGIPNRSNNCKYEIPPPSSMPWFYRFKRGPLNQEDQTHQVNGVLMKESNIVLKTDSLVVEALLGVNNALDPYSEHLQNETIKQKELENSREELAQEIIRSGDSTKADIFHKIYAEPETP